ncbi:RluA family pseudouridine synthase [Magnetococcales bacterium HHB-1]
MNASALEKRIIITEELADVRLDRALSLLCGDLSRAALQRLIREHCVTQGGQVVSSIRQRVKAGECFCLIVPEPEPSYLQPELVEFGVVYEDQEIIVVNKPTGLCVHPGAGIKTGTLVHGLLNHCDDLSGIGGEIRPGIVHRLDKETSGLLVVAKNDHSHRHLAEQFKAHTASRRYLAVVHGVPNPACGVITQPIGRDPRNRIRMAVVAGGRHAVTHYKVLQRFSKHFSLIRCHLKTGRTHQIRVHMKTLGHALVGDLVYGRKFVAPKKWSQVDQDFFQSFTHQALHAFQLEITHPTREKRMRFKAVPPEDFQQLVDLLMRYYNDA